MNHGPPGKKSGELLRSPKITASGAVDYRVRDFRQVSTKRLVAYYHALGEILADLATTGTTAHDISRFALARFQRG